MWESSLSHIVEKKILQYTTIYVKISYIYTKLHLYIYVSKCAYTRIHPSVCAHICIQILFLFYKYMIINIA